MQILFDKLAQLNFLELGISFVLGGIVSWVFGHYYFRRSLKKSLWIEVKSAFRVFEEFGENQVRELEVLHGGRAVKDLFLIDLQITNKSDRSIRDPIRPLAFKFPNANLLGAFLLKKVPEQNEISAQTIHETDAAFAEFHFDLLNPGDSFSCRFLFDGKVNLDLVTASITADDLPAHVKIRPAVGMVTKRPTKLGLADWIAVSVFCALFGIPIFLVGAIITFNDSPLSYHLWGYRLDVGVFAAVGVLPTLIGVALITCLLVGLFNIARLLLRKLFGRLANLIARIQSDESGL